MEHARGFSDVSAASLVTKRAFMEGIDIRGEGPRVGDRMSAKKYSVILISVLPQIGRRNHTTLL